MPFLELFEPNMFTITAYTKAILFVAAIALFLSLIVFLGSKRISTRIFALVPFFQSIWNINHALMHSMTRSESVQHLLLNNSHFLGLMLVSITLVFALSFPEDKVPSKPILWTIIGFQVATIPLYYILENFMVIITGSLDSVPWWSYTHGPGGDLFFKIPFFLFWVIGVYTLFTKAKQYPQPHKGNLRLMGWAIGVGAMIPSIVCVILPHLGYYDFTWMGSAFNFIWCSILAYAIIKHNQMNIRFVTTELLVLAAILLLLFSFLV